MILAQATDRSTFTVHINHRDLDCLTRLWTLVEQTQEPRYSTDVRQLTSLDPASSLKVLCLRPELVIRIGELTPQICLPLIFSGCLSSLRNLTFTNPVTRPEDVQGSHIFRMRCFLASPRLPCMCVGPSGKPLDRI